ncbi:MAG TPA: hypothetical protein VFE60_10165 [Roseiarcus sp.]|jgi:hypothetical protein|nr:hypothetical protein [Roseiarcus sp.]
MANDLAHVGKLTATEREIARLMTEGLDRDETILGEHVPAYQPLTLVQAAKAAGYLLRKARGYLADYAPFNQLRGQLLKARRESEGPRNLATAIKIRDDEGDGSAADRTVRLKAIGVIEGTSDKGPAVTVNVNQQNNVITPGYVIRLPAKAGQGAPMIEGSASP